MATDTSSATPALCGCGIVARRRCESCGRPVCESCDLGYSTFGAGCAGCAAPCRVCAIRPTHNREPLMRCGLCEQLVHSACMDDRSTRTVVDRADQMGNPLSTYEVAWRCRSCAAERAPQEAAEKAAADAANASEHERRKQLPQAFIDAMRRAGYPGADSLPVAGDSAYGVTTRVITELRCWRVWESEWEYGFSTKSRYLAADGRLYRGDSIRIRGPLGLGTKHVFALLDGRPVGVPDHELASTLQQLAHRAGISL